MIKAVVFDFDGTIADTLPVYIDIFNRLAKKYRLKEIRPEQVSRMKNKPIKQVMKDLHIPLFLVPIIIWRLKMISEKEIHKGTLFPDMEIALGTLSNNYDLFLITSNSKQNVEKFFEKYSIFPFKEIYSSRNFFNKSGTMKKLLKEHSLDASECLYVGDEPRDITSSKHADFKVVAVDWGYATSALLLNFDPDGLVSSPLELLEEIERISKEIEDENPNFG